MKDKLFGRYVKDVLGTLYESCKTAFDAKATNERKEAAYSQSLLAKGQLIGAVVCCDIYQPKYQAYLALNISQLSDDEMLKHDSKEAFADDYLKNIFKIDLSEENKYDDEEDEECER